MNPHVLRGLAALAAALLIATTLIPQALADWFVVTHESTCITLEQAQIRVGMEPTAHTLEALVAKFGAKDISAGYDNTDSSQRIILAGGSPIMLLNMPDKNLCNEFVADVTSKH